MRKNMPPFVAVIVIYHPSGAPVRAARPMPRALRIVSGGAKFPKRRHPTRRGRLLPQAIPRTSRLAALPRAKPGVKRHVRLARAQRPS